ncbi:hypothetical protein ACFLQ8_00325 [Candidatus Auribacterota bacterium]
MRDHVKRMRILVIVLCSQLCFGANPSTFAHAKQFDRSHLAPGVREDTYEDMEKISKAKRGGIKAFLNIYPRMKEVYGSDFIVENWQDIVALREEEKGESSIDYLFEVALPDLGEDVGKDWVFDHWTDLAEMAKAAKGQGGHFFGKVMPVIIRDFSLLLETAQWDLFRKRFLAILKHRFVSEHNRSKIYELLFDEKNLEVLVRNSADLSDHLAFYAVVITRERRPAYQILQGILKGFELGLVDAFITPDEQKKIFEFTDKMRNFSPTLFLLYKMEGEAALKPLEDFAVKILTDEIGRNDIFRFIESYNERGFDGKKILGAALQITIPASGTSFIKREDILELIDQYTEIGDLREHVPDSLRGKEFGGVDNEIKLIEWALGEGEDVDPDKKIKRLLELLRYRNRSVSEEQIEKNRQNDREILKTRLKSYLNGEVNGDEVLDTFLIYVSNDDLMREKVDRINTDDHQGLSMLEHIFVNKDNLSVQLEEIIKEVRSESKVQMPIYKKKTDKLKVRKPAKIASQIEGIWNSKSISPQNKKITLIEKIIQPLNSETQKQIIDEIKTRKVKKEVQRIANAPKKPQYLTAKGVVEELFERPITDIRKEKDKFEETESDESVELEFRVVKGIPWCLWGLNAGICNAWDLEMWKQPNFKLLAITDKKSGKAVGFVHLFEKTINGKKILVVPGIEPSAEFLSKVKAEKVYPVIEKALIRVATEGYFDELHFPTEKNKGLVLSNRSDIVKEVIKRYGENPITLDNPINWNFFPNPYPIKEVYVVWERSKVVLLSESISETMRNMIPELEAVSGPDALNTVTERIKLMSARLQSQHGLKSNDHRMKLLKALKPPANVNTVEQNLGRLVKRGVIARDDRAKFVALLTPLKKRDKVELGPQAKPEIQETIQQLIPELERIPTIPERLDLINETLKSVHNLSPNHPALEEFEDLRPPVALTLIDLTLNKLVDEKFVRNEDKLRLKDLLYPEMKAGAGEPVELREGEDYWSPIDKMLVRVVSIETDPAKDPNIIRFGEKITIQSGEEQHNYYRRVGEYIAMLMPASEAGKSLEVSITPEEAEEAKAKKFVMSNKILRECISRYSDITDEHGYKLWRELYDHVGSKDVLTTEEQKRYVEEMRKADTAGIDEEEAKKVAWGRSELSRDTVLYRFFGKRGTLDKLRDIFGSDLPYYWPGMVKLLMAPESSNPSVNLFDLCEKGLPASKRVFDDDLKKHWPGLVETAYGSGDTVDFFMQIEELDRVFDGKLPEYMRELNDLFENSGLSAKRELLRNLAGLKKLFGKDFIEYWPVILELGKSASDNYSLFKEGIPAARNTINNSSDLEEVGTFLIEQSKKIKERGNVLYASLNALEGLIKDKETLKSTFKKLNELGNACGDERYQLLGHVIPEMKKLFTGREDLNVTGDKLVELINGTGGNSGHLIYYVKKAKEKFAGDFPVYMPGLIDLGVYAGEDYEGFYTCYLAMYDLAKDKLNDKQRKKMLDDYAQLVKSAGKNRAYLKGVYVLLRQLGKDFPDHWPIILRLTESAGEDPRHLHGGLIELHDTMSSPEDMRIIGEGLIELYNAAGDGSGVLLDAGLPVLRKTFGKDLINYWPGLVQVGKTLKGNEVGRFYADAVPKIKEVFGKGLPQYWPDIVKLGTAKKVKSYSLFLYGIPNLRSLLGKDFFDYWPQIKALAGSPDVDTGYMLGFAIPTLKRLIGSKEDLKEVGGILVELGKKAGDYQCSLFIEGLKAVNRHIKTKEDLKMWSERIIELVELTPETEGPTVDAIKEMGPLIEKHPDLWQSFVIPVAKSQKSRSHHIYSTVTSIYYKEGIETPRDMDVIKYIATQKGVKASDILENLVLNGLNEGAIKKPLSSEQALIEEFIGYDRFPLTGVYEEFKKIKSKKLSPSVEKKRIEKMFGRMDRLAKAIRSGKVKPAQEKEKAFETVLMHVFPPAVTTDREKYGDLYAYMEDHSRHIPKTLKGVQDRKIKVEAGGYTLRKGEAVDEEPWRVLLSVVRKGNKEDIKPRVPADLGKELLTGLRDKELGREKMQSDMLSALYAHFRSSRAATLPESLGGYSNMMVHKVYTGDTLRELVSEALVAYKKKDRKGYERILAEIQKKKTKDYSGMSKQLYGVLNSYKAGKMVERKARGIIDKMLKPLGMDGSEMWPLLVDKDKKVIEEILLAREPVRETARDELAVQISHGLLGKQYAGMWEEMKKWEYKPGAEEIELTAVISKSKAHAVAGYNTGVCTVDDIKLWDNPDFMHLILFDENGVAQGGAHFLIIEEKGKRYLTLPGINPSNSLMNKVMPLEIYGKIISLAQDAAEAMGLEKEVLIPEDTSINSNCPEIQEIIASRGYQKPENPPFLSSVKRFSHEPDYTFQSVYIVPPKGIPEIHETIQQLIPELEKIPTIPERLDLINETLKSAHNLSSDHPALIEFEDLRPPVALTLIDLTLNKLVDEKYVMKEDKLRLKDLLYSEMTAGAPVEIKEGEVYWSPEDGKLVRVVSIERDNNYPEFGEKVKLMIDTEESTFYRNYIKLKIAQFRPADEAPGSVLQPEDDSFRMFDAKDPDEIAAKRYVTNETYIVKRITPEPFSSITVLHGYKPWKDLYIECGLSIVGMNALVEMFQNDLAEYWPFLVETALPLKKTVWNFFRYSLGSVKHLIKSQEDLETVMGLLLEMRANARNQTSAKNITEKLLPEVAHRVKNIDDLREIGAYLVVIDSENKGKTTRKEIESLIDAVKEHMKALNKGITLEEYMRAVETAVDIGA